MPKLDTIVKLIIIIGIAFFIVKNPVSAGHGISHAFHSVSAFVSAL